MPNRVIFNDVAETLKTQAYGDEINVPINLDEWGDLSVTGTVNVMSMTPITVTGTVGIQNHAVVGITGNPIFIIGGHSTTQIDQSFFITVPLNSVTTVYTSGIDISNMGQYSYYVRHNNSLYSVTVQSQIAPALTGGLTFINTSDSAVSIDDLGGIITDSDFLKYSRLKCSLGGALIPSYSVTVEVVFQGQY